MLVDITPDELIQRLHEGKVYLPQTARRATQNFFTPRNLTALARTRPAPHRRPGGRPDGRFAAPERDRGAVGDVRLSAGLHRPPTTQAEILVRTGGRMATKLNASWVVVHVAPAWP